MKCCSGKDRSAGFLLRSLLIWDRRLEDDPGLSFLQSFPKRRWVEPRLQLQPPIQVTVVLLSSQHIFYHVSRCTRISLQSHAWFQVHTQRWSSTKLLDNIIHFALCFGRRNVCHKEKWLWCQHKEQLGRCLSTKINQGVK